MNHCYLPCSDVVSPERRERLDSTERNRLISALSKNGYAVEDTGGRIVGRRYDMRLSVLFSASGSISAVLEEMDGTGTFLRLEAAPEKGINVSMHDRDGEISFVRTSRITRTELRLSR